METFVNNCLVAKRNPSAKILMLKHNAINQLQSPALAKAGSFSHHLLSSAGAHTAVVFTGSRVDEAEAVRLPNHPP